jgi:hypothetical protein
VHWDTRCVLQETVDEGARRGCADPDNRLRPSIVADPLFARKNTRDNTPAVVYVEIVAGSKVDVTVAAKGGGSENKARLTMLNPSDSFVDWVLETVPGMGEAVDPAGPTTSTRMDKFTDLMLEKTGLFAMIGKAERGPVAIESIRMHQAAYLIAIGGAAYLVSKAIRSARVVAFEDLGMEAIYEFEIRDMPVTVAVDARGGVRA